MWGAGGGGGKCGQACILNIQKGINHVALCFLLAAACDSFSQARNKSRRGVENVCFSLSCRLPAASRTNPAVFGCLQLVTWPESRGACTEHTDNRQFVGPERTAGNHQVSFQLKK